MEFKYLQGLGFSDYIKFGILGWRTTLSLRFIVIWGF